MDENLSNLMNFSDFMAQDPNLQPLNDIIEQIMGMPNESLTEDTVDIMIGMFTGALTPRAREDAVEQVIKGFEEENYTRATAQQVVDGIKTEFDNLVETLSPSPQKRRVLNSVLTLFVEIFDTAMKRYHVYDVELSFKLDEGGKVPTYVHDSDACADIYASENIVIKAHSFGTMVHTGIHMGIPEGWCVKFVPRSSIGAKTPLRLSNMMAVIDSGYLGEVGILFDNLSDSDYEIKAGDRIAQMWLERVHKFKAKIVDSLEETERGEGGFGSSGK